jgi:hypothetical protein
MMKTFVLSVLCASVLAVSISLVSVAEVQFPNACVPRTVANVVVKKIVVRDVEKFNGSTFYLTTVEGMRKDEKFPAVMRKQGKKCYLSYADPGGESGTLSYGVPVPVVKEFTLKNLKHHVISIGTSRYQSEINSQTNFSPEDAWAIKKLGFILPSNAKIQDWNKEPSREVLINE